MFIIVIQKVDERDRITILEEKDTTKNTSDEYEKICYICRRPESKAGAMITVPGGLCVCRDCMQKTFDSVMNGGLDFSQIQNMPYMNLNLNNLNQNMPKMEIPNGDSSFQKGDTVIIVTSKGKGIYQLNDIFE